MISFLLLMRQITHKKATSRDIDVGGNLISSTSINTSKKNLEERVCDNNVTVQYNEADTTYFLSGSVKSRIFVEDFPRKLDIGCFIWKNGIRRRQYEENDK